MTSRLPILSAAAISLGLILSGCGGSEAGQKRQDQKQADGWTTAPHVQQAQIQGDKVTISGLAGPDMRVVLRGEAGEVYAVDSDRLGEFSFALSLTGDRMILTPEVHAGQDAIRGPEQLLLWREANLAVMQTQSGVSRRLSPAPRLDAIDGDDQALVASGRAAAFEQLPVSIVGSFEVEVQADAEGRWQANLPGIKNRPVSVRIGDLTFSYPGPGAGLGADETERFEAVEGGWRLARRVGPDSVITSWYPEP